MTTKSLILIFLCSSLFPGCNIADRSAEKEKKIVPSDTYKGLVMAGYQGWFNAEGDGADRGWFHYQKDGRFEPGFCTIDMWPEMSEYTDTYKTDFKFEDGTSAYVFSSFDQSTTDLHFSWMQEYGIDGVFMQRFVSTIKGTKGFAHYDKILESAFTAAEKYGRVICIMYDLSGMNPEDYQKVIDDWKYLVTKYNLLGEKKPASYLSHRGKPLVAVWGIGFNDNRKYGLSEASLIIDFLKNDPQYGGTAVQIGVPTYWRELRSDAIPDSVLHNIMRMADIVHPWFVGRYKTEAEYDSFRELIVKDLAWCSKNGLDYVPTVFPGLSWKNLYPSAVSNQIPRNRGNFLWKQLSGAVSAGAEMIYVAMFDEIDEGTAIFKCAREVPVVTPDQVAEGGIMNVFVPIVMDIPSDHFLWLTGQAARMIRKEIPFTAQMPSRN
ncbi:MAG: xylosidase [Bacteroidia bacterium]|nr:MAG: xylosidase [Bacteroidia bacterium]